MKNIITKEFLIMEYKQKSVSQIAQENNIPNTSMYKLFNKYQITRRTQIEVGKLRIIEHLCLDCGKQVSRKEYQRCKACETKRKHKEYCCLNCGIKISNSNGLYGQHKCSSCSNKGQNNPFYHKQHTTKHKKYMSLINGGTGIPYELSQYPENFNQELKESIRKRDDYKCQNCGMTEEEHIIVYSIVLHVHHIDYNKKNINLDNLIALCVSCNNRANFNRNYWQKYYINKINEFYLVDLGEKEK